MTINKKNSPIKTYLAKDYSTFKSELLKYSKTFFFDKMQDFSEASIGGLFLDMAAAVGDNLSFYLDHQFRETIWSDAVELANVEKMVQNSGVKIVGASPSTVDLEFYIEVPAISDGYKKVPDETALPVILEGTVLLSKNGVPFTTIEDLDFSKKDRFNNLLATIVSGDTDDDGLPSTFILKRKVTAVSGRIYVESFSFDSNYVPYRTSTLSNPSVSEVLSVIDSEGDYWYEVESLTQDTAYVGILSVNEDNDLVKANFKIVPAPKRYILNTNIQSRNSTLLFGSGDPTITDDDAFPDASKYALPLYGKTAMTRFSLDPNSLMRSRTMGVTPVATTLTVTYRAGGGVNHNVGVNSIRTLSTLKIDFKNGASPGAAAGVRASIDVTNPSPAVGGSQPPTIDTLRAMIPAARNMQSRIVTKNDLLSRVYSLPSKFGSVHKASARQNSNNQFSTLLYVLSRDTSGRLIYSPDSLKKNLKLYLNDYRLISDAIDIVDASILNIGIKVGIVVDPDANSQDVVKTVIARLQTMFNTSKMQIDQSIVLSELTYKIINVQGVLSLTNLEITNLFGEIDDISYSSIFYDVKSNTKKGIVICPPGSIFEIKYPNLDIVVSTN